MKQKTMPGIASSDPFTLIERENQALYPGLPCPYVSPPGRRGTFRWEILPSCYQEATLLCLRVDL